MFGFQIGGASAKHMPALAHAGLKHEDLLVHDYQQRSSSRLAGLLQAHELAYMLGHADVDTAMRYYHPHPADIVT